MEHEKLYVIREQNDKNHINKEIHLYGYLTTTFWSGSMKAHCNMPNIIDTAQLYKQVCQPDIWSLEHHRYYLMF